MSQIAFAVRVTTLNCEKVGSLTQLNHTHNILCFQGVEQRTKAQLEVITGVLGKKDSCSKVAMGSMEFLQN